MKIVFLSFCLFFNLTFFDNKNNKIENQRISLTAEVLEIKKGGGSGTLIQYHHVRLRVLNVCDGEETRPEIIVTYVSVSTEEVDDLTVGDIICLSAVKTEKFKEGIEEWRKLLREYGRDTTELNDENLPTHFGGGYIKNCQCYK
jgi:hypothetical protein